MKRIWVLYLFCIAFGVFSIYMASSLIGPYPLTDSRHSVAFYVWEMSAALFLLVAVVGILINLFDLTLEK